MLFEVDPNIIESEKERNLYYKFFAGYFFNELVPGYEQRVESFFKKHILHPKEKFGPEIELEYTHIDSVHATFDYHAYLVDKEADRGELADILLLEPKNDLVIAIEAKFLSDWRFEKDVQRNSERIELLPNKKKVQCLLISDQKLRNSKSKINQPGSNFKKLKDNEGDLKFPFRIITWQALFRDCEDEKIRVYFENHIENARAETLSGR
ncbi:hypothetical protein D3OALGA1CA_5098 [Olavius algarvensis associated proteobacterium Delta 3]|nr:hypothetical protein D3OALGA1CA_5098 [Olavius algarvensis associated proteobacterium Delta 3]